MLRQAVQSDWGFEDRFDAQVWLLDMSQRLKRFVPDAATRIDMLKTIHYESRRVGIEPELVLAVIEVESHFDEYAVSVAGARGLMQVMPFWLDSSVMVMTAKATANLEAILVILSVVDR